MTYTPEQFDLAELVLSTFLDIHDDYQNDGRGLQSYNFARDDIVTLIAEGMSNDA
jgi:hypothetical protein